MCPHSADNIDTVTVPLIKLSWPMEDKLIHELDYRVYIMYYAIINDRDQITRWTNPGAVALLISRTARLRQQ